MGHDVPDQALITKLLQTTLSPHAGRPLGMVGVESALVPHGAQEWLVCRVPQDPGCARLLDVAVALRGDKDLPCLAILAPPADKERKQGASDKYLRAYQGIGWHGLGVAFVLDDAQHSFAPANIVPETGVGAAFGVLVAEIESALRHDAQTLADGSRWIVPEDSREAESLVRITMNRVLYPKGYRRHVEEPSAPSKAYTGFWRRAEADGLWTNKGEPVQHLALESKLNEDIEAPLCQVVDHLAHAMTEGGNGGVVNVRVHRAGKTLAPHTAAMTQLETALLVRYLDVVLDT